MGILSIVKTERGCNGKRSGGTAGRNTEMEPPFSASSVAPALVFFAPQLELEIAINL
jgi:hypothetical protein